MESVIIILIKLLLYTGHLFETTTRVDTFENINKAIFYFQCKRLVNLKSIPVFIEFLSSFLHHLMPTPFNYTEPNVIFAITKNNAFLSSSITKSLLPQRTLLNCPLVAHVPTKDNFLRLLCEF